MGGGKRIGDVLRACGGGLFRLHLGRERYQVLPPLPLPARADYQPNELGALRQRLPEPVSSRYVQQRLGRMVRREREHLERLGRLMVGPIVDQTEKDHLQ